MNNKVYVWDPLVRFFHWTLVIAFTIAYLTGEEESLLHAYSGYYILGLLAIRIVWGFFGSHYARFSQFIYPPAAVIDYIKRLFSFNQSEKPARKYIGHNPAGGWMVITLLISLLATSYSGLKVYGYEGYGPLASNATSIVSQQQGRFIKVSSSEHEEDDDNSTKGNNTNEANEEFWEEIHEFLANFTVLLIALHIGGVLLSSKKHHQNLAKSMLTGFKDP
ncbi:Cytochrome b [hydrothermal vent metagenome]|uniref:Cytochrome b n=1 Tax=hydrothermal vent metagenome TaxID=652676 RepID=A0A3B0ZPZ9_9ZZZZ